MIKSKEDYLLYVESDRIAMGIPRRSVIIDDWLILHPIWYFIRKLRQLEYYKNCKIQKSIIYKIYYYFLKFRFRKLSIRLGFSIPENVFGPGLCIPHYGTIVINSKARVGKNCKIHVCVNIGASGGQSLAPVLGDNIYIAPGVKIFGNIQLANNIAIGANSTVNKSFEEENILIAGSPAKRIKEMDVSGLINSAS